MNSKSLASNEIIIKNNTKNDKSFRKSDSLKAFVGNGAGTPLIEG